LKYFINQSINHMKKTIITLSAAIFVAVAAVVGIAGEAMAIGPAPYIYGSSRPAFSQRPVKPISPVVRPIRNDSVTRVKLEAIRKALAANDYSAWVSAIKQINRMH
jgi:hypothetical protein